jgi:hypothetical protein
MDDHFFNSEFERFLQQQVKQHRMYPSDAVWKGIYKQVHGDRKWPGLYFIAILLIAALTVCTVLMESTPIVSQQVAVAKERPAVNQLDPVQVTRETITFINNRPQATDNSPVSSPVTGITNEVTVPVDRTAIPGNPGNGINENLMADAGLPQNTFSNSALVLAGGNQDQPIEKPVFIAEQKPAQQQAVAVKKDTETEKPEELTAQEIASLSKPVKAGRWQYEFYITPSSSYRQLVDQKPSAEQFSGPVASNYGVSANQVIRYKPGMGIEFGLGVLYRLSDRIRVKTSLQYNVRQYNIEAFTGNYEIANIALIRGGNIDSIATVAKYRSTSGTNEALLLNKYHQVSLPVGIEYALVDSRKFGVNLATSVQPTYTFSQSSYLLTSDYKSYADGTAMIRRWNVNSSLEATFSYKVGDFQWKLGPQIRYQHLPTYSDPYPIKEYLIDYGFKIGFTKTIK